MASSTRKKVGLKRIDAALDALLPMGFPENVVRRTVKTLLKVYGGEAGWAFIEEASYKMVIDTILEDQEKCGKEENAEPKSSIQGSLVEDVTLHDGPRVAHSPLDHSGQVLSSPQVDTILLSLKDDALQDKPVVKVPSPQIHSAGVHSKEIRPRQLHPLQVHTPDNVSPSLVHTRRSLKDDMLQDKSGGQINFLPLKEIHSSELPSPHVDSPQMVDRHPIRKRKPCYGWISSDDEEENLVYLTPAK